MNLLTESALAPAPNRSFPVFHPDGSLVYPEYAYPVRKEIVPIWLAAFIAFFAPLVFFVLFQIRRKSLDDLLTTIMGLLKSLITAAVLQVLAFNNSFSSLLFNKFIGLAEVADRRVPSSFLRCLHAKRGPILPTFRDAICELHVRPVSLHRRQESSQRRARVVPFRPLDCRICWSYLPCLVR